MSLVIENPNCQNPVHQKNDKLFGHDCNLCGTLIQYADDTTFHTANKHRQWNQIKLNQNLDNIGEFLTANKLTINKDKTHIMEIMIRQKRGRIANNPPELEALNDKDEIEIIKCKDDARILGMNIQKDLTWNAHLETGSKALLPSLRGNIGSLRNCTKMIPQSSRNILARGLINSRLMYLISIWGGHQEFTKKSSSCPKHSCQVGNWKKEKNQDKYTTGTDKLVLSHRTSQTELHNTTLESYTPDNTQQTGREPELGSTDNSNSTFHNKESNSQIKISESEHV